jgi:hypothetical protein
MTAVIIAAVGVVLAVVSLVFGLDARRQLAQAKRAADLDAAVDRDKRAAFEEEQDVDAIGDPYLRARAARARADAARAKAGYPAPSVGASGADGPVLTRDRANIRLAVPPGDPGPGYVGPDRRRDRGPRDPTEPGSGSDR